MPASSILRRLATLCIAICLALPAFAQQARRPNVILIVSDDQGWWDVGIHGNKDVETPTLDRLASEGVELTHFYVAPVCAPTRAGLMTGRHFVRTGLYNTRFGGDTLNPDEVTMAEVLHEAGYRTGMFGKWHLGEYRRHAPWQRGFDEAIYFPAGHTERYFYPEFLLKNGAPIHARGHITDVLTDAAITFVRENRERPFFLYVPYNVPHSPHFVTDKLYQKYAAKGLDLTNARIYGLIEQMDAAINRLLAVVDEEGLREDTIVFFMSDNGGISRHYRAGLSGGKGSVFEGGVRSPFFARWPGRFAAGRKTSAHGSHLDMLPTICELVGAQPPADRKLDGKSLAPLLTGRTNESPHELLFHMWDRFQPSLQARWAVSGQRYKLVGEKLFDLDNDPGEKRDIAADEPAIAEELKRQFLAWFGDVSEGRTFEPLPIVIGDPIENPIDLYPSWARHSGTQANVVHPYAKPAVPPGPVGDNPVEESTNYTFDAYDWDTIDSWKERGESVRWVIEVDRAGEYEVALVYGCDAQDAGGRFAIDVGGQTLEGEVAATPSPTIFEAHRVGSVTLAKGPAELRVRVIDAPGHELMKLNRVRLERK